MKHIKLFEAFVPKGDIYSEKVKGEESPAKTPEQQFREIYPTLDDFNRAFNKFLMSKECIDRFGRYPSGNLIDPMYDRFEEDKIRMMIKPELEKIDPQNRSGWREAIEGSWYLLSLRNKLPYSI